MSRFSFSRLLALGFVTATAFGLGGCMVVPTSHHQQQQGVIFVRVVPVGNPTNTLCAGWSNGGARPGNVPTPAKNDFNQPFAAGDHPCKNGR